MVWGGCFEGLGRLCGEAGGVERLSEGCVDVAKAENEK